MLLVIARNVKQARGNGAGAPGPAYQCQRLAWNCTGGYSVGQALRCDVPTQCCKFACIGVRSTA